MRDFGSIAKGNEIPWVRHWINTTYEFSKNFVKDDGKIDFEALGREEWEFRKALWAKDFSKNERAKFLWDEACKIHKAKVENGKKGGRPRKNNSQDATHGNAVEDRKSPTSCDQFKADATTREDVVDRKSGTSADIYGDSGRREAPDESTTVSQTFPRRPAMPAATNGRTARTVRGSRCSIGAVRPLPPSLQDMYDYAADGGLDMADAREWFDMCEDRQWRDREGKTIKSWKAALRAFCRAKQARRSA